MHKPESVLENETEKILWDFEILTHNQRPDLVNVNNKNNNNKKENQPNSGLCNPGRLQCKNQRKRRKKRQILIMPEN